MSAQDDEQLIEAIRRFEAADLAWERRQAQLDAADRRAGAASNRLRRRLNALAAGREIITVVHGGKVYVSSPVGNDRNLDIFEVTRTFPG